MTRHDPVDRLLADLTDLGFRVTTDGAGVRVTPPPVGELLRRCLQAKWGLVARLAPTDRCARCGTPDAGQLLATYWGPRLCRPCTTATVDTFDVRGWPPVAVPATTAGLT